MGFSRGDKIDVMRNIVLASKSPRRKLLLRAMGLSFDVIPSNFKEQLDDKRDPELVAKELALGKALDVAKQQPEAIVIGCDSIASIDGKQLGKPSSQDDALSMLKLLAGRQSYVSSGVAVVCIEENLQLTDVDTTIVHFADYDTKQAEAYVRTGDSMDKAGGYGIQKSEGTLIERIEGNYDTVLGLPTSLLATMLGSCGISARCLVDEEARTIAR